MTEKKLSICVATYNRGNFIAETLDSIMVQLPEGVEVVVVDGASPDNTAEVMARYIAQYPGLRYFREEVNSGVDADYDKAVGYATGEYCWLMTDDDLLKPGAIRQVLGKLRTNPDLLIVNAEVRNADFTKVLNERLIEQSADRQYKAGDEERLFVETAQGLSFIGCVVIRRDVWLARNRQAYFGSLFVHVGVIFQQLPIACAELLAAPLITIRYGNAMWTPRGLEIWIEKWPSLIWSFNGFTEKAKSKICPRDGWHLVKRLVFYRATGAYTCKEYTGTVRAKVTGVTRLIAGLVSILPITLASSIAAIHCVVLGGRGARMIMNSLVSGPKGSFVVRWAARAVGV